MKYLIITVALSLFVSFSYADSQGDKNREILLNNSPSLTPEEYQDIKATIDTEELKRGRIKEKEMLSIVINKDWASCEQGCYDNRKTCFKLGADASTCDRIYDKCKAGCK